MSTNTEYFRNKIQTNTTFFFQKYSTLIYNSLIINILNLHSMNKKIGKLIEERVKAQKISVTEFANKINKERSNVYDIFKRDSIDTHLLKKIGQVLQHDFFQYFLEPETVQKIKISEDIKKSKILVELELNEDEITKIGFEEKILKILNKK